jgi:hypothetical protein
MLQKIIFKAILHDEASSLNNENSPAFVPQGGTMRKQAPPPLAKGDGGIWDLFSE